MNKRNLHLLLTIAIFFISNNSLSQLENERLDSLLNRAYSIISSNPKEAISLFEEAAQLAPENVSIQKQIGYLYIDENDNESALKYFKLAEQISPSDTIKLQIAYLLNALNRNDEALEYFKQIKESSDKDIRSKAQSAIIVLEANKPIQKFPWWGEIYTSPYYDTRFHTIFNFIQIKEGYYLTHNKLISLLATLQVTSDTKSRRGSEGQIPVIFSDNAAILGAGFNFNPVLGLNFTIQSGIGIDLIKIAGEFKIKEDFRAVITYGNGIYPEISVTEKPTFVAKPLSELYSSFGYYSRYKNSIGYASVKGGLRFLEFRRSALDFYLRLNFALDTERQFYNNIIELGSGIKLIPDHLWGLSFLAEFNRGKYLIIPPTTTQSKYYSSFRFYLIYGLVL
ncbi:MAG: hypothetical protein IGBAC_0065 [Ignavibacteriae bacterium]|nr:MAG: hypothetical protein IGBAC_0065 [Ignavibacteriota bacterium]